MGKKKKEPPPTGGLEQNGIEKRLCNGICLCQLVSIISGVALLYLSVIIVSPNKKTLDAQFRPEPVVCTTLRVVPGKCDLPSCGEWCMSKGGSSCPIVEGKVRFRGSAVRFSQCTGMQERFCSAQEYNETQQFICSEGENKVGQCDNLNYFMECTSTKQTKKIEGVKSNMTSLCRNITAIMECTGDPNAPSTVATKIRKCSRYTCNNMTGIYDCYDGHCKKYIDPKCIPRCSTLKMGNIGIVTPDLFRWGSCARLEANGTEIWNDASKPLSMYCTRIRNVSATELEGEDCLNGTLTDPERFSQITNYKEILALLQEYAEPLSPTNEVLPSEAAVEISNTSKVMINIQGCVNTLQKECTRWMAEKSRDGSDGMHPAVYPCYITPHDTAYVITAYDRDETMFQLVLAAVIPSSLLILSCCCLFLCGKTVGVNEFGLFFCKPCHKQDGDGGKQPTKLRAQ